jgi:hypothetical protein
MVTPQAGQIGGRSSGRENESSVRVEERAIVLLSFGMEAEIYSLSGRHVKEKPPERRLRQLRGRDSNPNFLIQSQASYR